MTDYKDHWEAQFDRDYLRWFHLQGHEVTVEIESIERKELTLRGGAKKKSPVIRFVGKDKPLVMNYTNMESISEIHGKSVKDWVGKKVVLYQSETQLKGKTVDCIRIKPVTKGTK